MKTTPGLIAAALLTAGASLSAQQAAPPPQQAQPEQRAQETGRRPGPAAPAPREGGRGEMNAPGQGAWAPGQPQPPRPDPFTENFFPPEMIMHHQRALGLGDDQRKRLIEIVQKSQPQFTELQWQLEAEQATLMSLMRAERPDEKQITMQLDKVLRLEGEMKRGQLMMLVRLKNELTADQQAKLRENMRRPRW